MINKQIVLPILLIALGVLGIAQIFSKKSACFSSDFVYCPKENLERIVERLSPLQFPSNDIRSLFDRPFYFLGSGNQMFAFLSEDGKVVLKLMKFHTYPFWNDDPKKWEKWARVFEGFSVASQSGGNHAALLDVHLPHEDSLPLVLLYDRAGRKHTLDLNRYFFALQEKAEALGSVLKTHLNAKEPEKALAHLKALLAMLETEWQEGIYDHDHNIMSNTGFVRGMPMRIDTGKLVRLPHPMTEQEQNEERHKLVAERILPWVKKHFAEHYPLFLSSLN
jgi:hypothetical protein